MRTPAIYAILTISFPIVAGPTLMGQCTSLDMRDENNDQHIDLLDLAAFVDCLADPDSQPEPTPPRTAEHCLFVFDHFTFDEVSLLSFRGFQNSFTGPIRPECFNRIFVSSSTFPTTLGSAAAYDAQCNEIATNRGWNNPTGTNFMAWISTASSSAKNRLGITARGFVRTDGVPVADTVSSLVAQNAVLNSINVDEHGDAVPATSVMTGTNADGTASASNCANWTSASPGQMHSGNTFGGPSNWTFGIAQQCHQGPFRIYCIQRDSMRPLPPTGRTGRLLFLTHNTFVPDPLLTPDEFCEQEKPAGAGEVRALIAYTDQAASAFINPGQEYVRPDGQFVGLGSNLVAATMSSGIWQTSQGVYLQSLVWTGSTSITTPGTAASTCDDWTSTASATGRAGLSSLTTSVWFSVFNYSCSTPWRMYCIEVD